MPPRDHYLGEFEQLLLLAILRLGANAYGAGLARELESEAGRPVSRGALYATLDRLETKGLVRWKIAPGGDERGRLPRRVYTATARGVASIRSAQRAFRRMGRGLEALLRDPS
ncbi:MAG TPA: helix-turn-helix transcriptional regulator [Vicinamibacterales bacterium]|nr:helix-turn-helix transcriptional regulator [Vicinamibacterales bacterium]